MRLIFGLAGVVCCLGLAVLTGGNLASLSLAGVGVTCENADERCSPVLSSSRFERPRDGLSIVRLAHKPVTNFLCAECADSVLRARIAMRNLFAVLR